MNLFDQLSNLTFIPDAYEQWADYRANMTKLICQSCEGGSIAIFGVGECNDFDLKLLVNQFEKINLIDKADVDINTLAKKYLLTSAEIAKIDVYKYDIVGISDDDYRGLCSRLSEFLRCEEDDASFVDYALSEYEKLLAGNNPLTVPVISDYIVASGIHSQLYNMAAWIWDTYAAHKNINDRRIYELISRAIDMKISEVNDNLIKMGRKKVMISSELRRIGTKGGVEGAYQCLLDINRRSKENIINIESVEMLMWPFDLSQQKMYEMELIVFTH